jgi:lipoate-protein ligase B
VKPALLANLGHLEYEAAWALQKRLVERRQKDEIPDVLVLVEHPHVITLGRGARASDHVLAPGDMPLYEIERGGDVTYHGPGQLVGYPVARLDGAERDLHRYLRNLEEVLIRAVARWEVRAERRPGLTGVWASGRKIASIGVAVRKWVTLHGFALNVAPDLSHFAGIVPCGVSDTRYGVTSLVELGRAATLSDVDIALRAEFTPLFGALAQDQALRSTENNSSPRRSAISSAVASR